MPRLFRDYSPESRSLLIGREENSFGRKVRKLLSVLSGVSRLPEVHAARQQLAALGSRVVGAAVLDCEGETERPTPAPTHSRKLVSASKAGTAEVLPRQ